MYLILNLKHYKKKIFNYYKYHWQHYVKLLNFYKILNVFRIA